MAITYIRGVNPIWWIPDLVGNPLDDSYYISFLDNVFPYLPSPVYHDNQGVSQWGQPIQFLANGTLPVDIFFNPDQVYRIEIRQGPLSTDPLIYEIDNWVPDASNIIPPSGTNNNQENQISNPQFAFINFVSPLTISAAGTYNIAPGWQLVLAGSGTCVVTQLITDAAQNQPGTNIPPYALNINTSGSWTSVILEQTFNGLGGIWANQFISGTVFARSDNGVANPLVMSYVPNSPGSPTVIATTGATGLPIGTAYGIIQGSAPLPVSTNTTLNNAAYINIQISLPNIGSVSLSNVQVTGQDAQVDVPFSPLLDETLERQEDHLFHYYANSLITQPKNSLLAGWNFALNPWQFRSSTPANVASNQYTADQTIVIQQAYVASATGNNVAVGTSTFTGDNQALSIAAVTANNQFAILQYIDPQTIRPYWGRNLSSLVKAFINTAHNTALKIKMRLIYKAGLPGTVSQTDPIASWTAGADPVAAAGYTLIAPDNDPIYTLTTASTNFSFNRFLLPASTDINMTLGVMLYTMNNMNQTATADIMFVNSVSLVPNDFAIETEAETWDESLRKCQFYYEKSYDPGSLPGATSAAGAATVQLSSATGNIAGLDRPFKVTKRATPTVTWYSPVTGTAARVRDVTGAADLTVSANVNTGLNSTGFVTTSAPGADGDEIEGQWTADARLGL